ncbi:hypothetical protein IGL98_003348 [Enterococcus sp. DIV0840]|uniref:response regulator transcription factor n=1 Tax=unclassified Enterococcus TaxID=2608891 RepID=UPI001A8EC119|nr:response regulator transcription factor [Enterococcus sp. DIV0849a]MBO0433095.1 response regulator transcription factor [Enterococcus sp. DIV0849a]
MKRILFVDDDQDYCLFMEELLSLKGYHVTSANNAILGLKFFKEKIFDLVISDLQMVSVDGLQFLSLLREISPDIKVIILTNSDNEDDEYRGLDLNVNEYIKKTVSVKIISKRIEKVLEEDFVPVTEELFSKNEYIRVNVKTRKIYKNNELVEVTLKEFDLLVLLLKNKNKVLSREKIIKDIWREDFQIADTRVIDTHIKNLRSKLYLTSVYSIRGIGYEWAE